MEVLREEFSEDILREILKIIMTDNGSEFESFSLLK